MEFFTLYETDPCHALIGSPIALSLYDSLRPLSGPYMEDDEEEAAELDRYFRRWITFRSHTSRIMKEMENLVSRMDCRRTLKRGEIVGVDARGLPDLVR